MGDFFEIAEKIVQETGPVLENFNAKSRKTSRSPTTTVQIGPFLYSHSPNGSVPFFTYTFHAEDGRDVRVSIGFLGRDYEKGREFAFFKGVTVRDGRLLEELLRYKIHQEQTWKDASDFPTFDYTWLGSLRRDNKIAEPGQLSSVRICLTRSNEPIIYEGDSLQCNRTHIDNVLASIEGGKKYQLPDSLLGVSELLGRPVPHKIDYNKRGLEILALSGFERFAAAVKEHMR